MNPWTQQGQPWNKPPKPQGNPWTHYGQPWLPKPAEGPAGASGGTSGGDPFDAVYQTSLTNLGTGYHNTLLGIGDQENAGAADYGFSLQRDPEGNVSGFSADPNNPFSKMAQLQRAYEETVRGSTNSYAAQGQLYSGALRNAQSTNLLNKQHGESDLLRGWQNLLNSLKGQRNTATNDYNSGVTNAGWQHVQALNGGAY